MRKIVVILVFLIIKSIFCFSQNISGDAKSFLTITKKAANYGGNIPYFATIYANNSSKKIRLNVKVQVLSDCAQSINCILEPSETKETVQPPCEITANFVAEPQQTPITIAPPIKQPTKPLPLIEEGNYRIKNSQTGDYLYLSIDSIVTNKTYLLCDSVTKNNWEKTKWKIINSPSAPCIPNRDIVYKENYRLISKENGFSIINDHQSNIERTIWLCFANSPAQWKKRAY